MSYKYVMFEVKMKTVKFLVPVIFPDKLVHALVAQCIEVCLNAHFKGATISAINAGTVDDLEVESVSGKSDTLKLKSDKADADVINTYPYLHGVVT